MKSCLIAVPRQRRSFKGPRDQGVSSRRVRRGKILSSAPISQGSRLTVLHQIAIYEALSYEKVRRSQPKMVSKRMQLTIVPSAF